MALTLSFSYIGLPQVNPATGIAVRMLYRPMVPLQIGLKTKFSLSFEALVDSGADHTLLPMDIGESIGIDFKKLAPNKARGIGGKEITTYFFPILIKIEDQIFKTTAYFSKSVDFPLLGRDGFFNLFSSLTFDQKKKRLTLELA